MTERVLLRNGNVIDGTGAAPRPRTDVLIEGDDIVAVGVDAAVAANIDGAATTNIDVSGLTVMPGLIDSHCHITFGEPSSNRATCIVRRGCAGPVARPWRVARPAPWSGAGCR